MRAKELHPDRNKSDNAHEQFVLLNEAYEYLMHVGTPKAAASTDYQWSEQQWREQQREATKARAREYARMRYEEYINSDHYKQQVLVDVVTSHLGILASAVLLVVFPIVSLTIAGSSAWGPIIAVTVILFPLHLKSFRNLQRASMTTFLKSFVDLIKLQWFQLMVLTIFNVVVIAKIGAHTLIRPLYLVLFLVALMTLYHFIFNRQKLVTRGIAPLTLSILLLLNFTFSSGEVVERYPLQSYNLSDRDDTLITIQGGIYDEFIGIRLFSDYSEVVRAREVVYHFKDGLFGVRVLVNYQLLPSSGFDYYSY